MFCVIQEVNVRKASRGNPRSLEVYESCFLINGVEYRHYRFQKSRECFERPIKKAYRISIHKSYREQGKVKKKQVVICTVNYYDIVDGFSWFGDHVRGGLEAKAKALGLTEAELCEMVEEKLQPIIDRIEAEYKQTKEYAASQEHDRIIAEWGQKREAFAKEYGVDQDEYDRCFDVFGVLRNPEYLEKIKADCEAQKEYERRSRESSRSYYENYHNNYSGESSYCGNSVNTYTENNRSVLKKFYRVLAKTFHPDSNPDADTSAEMKVLNQLKNDWGM
ncbi:MAG: hypothetical protein K1W25_18170 [Lachnospiraceae bacterium]